MRGQPPSLVVTKRFLSSGIFFSVDRLRCFSDESTRFNLVVKILDRYLARAVIGGTLLTLAVLLPLLALFILADEMDEVGENGYRFVDAALFVALSIPRYAYQIFPIATLIGALVGLGSLASRSELVAMRAAGVSIARVVFAALKGGVLLAIVAVAVGEGLAPTAEQKALKWRSEAQSGQVTLKTDVRIMGAGRKLLHQYPRDSARRNLRGIYIYEFDQEHRLTRATHADEARYVDGRWVLEGISRSGISEERVRRQPCDAGRLGIAAEARDC